MYTQESFFKDLDSLLAKIIKEENHDNELTTILKCIETEFHQVLQLDGNCLYEKKVADFENIYSSGSITWNNSISSDSTVIKKIREHGSFIYNDHDLRKQFLANHDITNLVPTAISITSPDERQWLMVFALRNDWRREEITLFLNALRTTINYRLFSETLGSEFKKAVQIQKSLLPSKAPKIDGYHIAARSVAAELVGGDFYEYFKFDEGNFGIAIGDVSGHGLAAALSVRDVIIGLHMGMASEHKTVPIIKKLNKVLYDKKFESNYVSLFIGEIENDGHLFYVNAGHPCPFVVTRSEIIDLKPSGIVLGYLENIDLHRLHIHLEPDSILVLYTDGLPERENLSGEHYDLTLLKKLVLDNQSCSPQELTELIFKKIHEFGNRTKWTDDATIVILKRNSI
jgi:sigma-B regulation protein RsbU (phosphoserine phosphatase)